MMRAATASANTQAMLTMFVGVACLSINDTLAKALTQTYSPIQVLFIRNLLALPVAALLVASNVGWTGFRSSKPGAHAIRGLIWLAAATLFFTGLIYVPLAEATALIFMAPIIITALSVPLLGERVGPWRWSAVVVGFLGVLIVVQPGAETFQPASLFPLATAFLYALLMLTARWVARDESVWTMMFYLVGSATLYSGVAASFFWSPIRAEHAWLFVAIALFGTAGMTMMTQAFRQGEAALVAPIDYSALLWASALGWLFFSEVPAPATYLGGAIIIFGGLVILVREHRQSATIP